jgi:hypothetical protein
VTTGWLAVVRCLKFECSRFHSLFKSPGVFTQQVASRRYAVLAEWLRENVLTESPRTE